MHDRWFDKTRPPPDWMVFDDAEIVRRARNRNDRRRMQYYRDLWLRLPIWASRVAVMAIYREAHVRRQAGDDVVVDHIIPLHGALVSGLHCEANLRVIDRRLNHFLSNTRYPGAPQLEMFGDTWDDGWRCERYHAQDAVQLEDGVRRTIHAAHAPIEVRAKDQVPQLRQQERAQRREGAASGASAKIVPLRRVSVQAQTRRHGDVHVLHEFDGSDRGGDAGVRVRTGNAARIDGLSKELQ